MQSIVRKFRPRAYLSGLIKTVSITRFKSNLDSLKPIPNCDTVDVYFENVSYLNFVVYKLGYPHLYKTGDISDIIHSFREKSISNRPWDFWVHMVLLPGSLSSDAIT